MDIFSNLNLYGVPYIPYFLDVLLFHHSLLHFNILDILKNNHFLYIHLINVYSIHLLQQLINNIHKTLTLDIPSINAYHIIHLSFEFCLYVNRNYIDLNLHQSLLILQLLNNFNHILLLLFIILFHLLRIHLHHFVLSNFIFMIFWILF